MERHKQFDYHEFLKHSIKIQKQARTAILKSLDEAIRGLQKELDEAFSASDTKQDRPLRVAFIGQYNAGKSTIIKALTRRDDIRIDADVCTTEAVPYDWDTIQVVDTPGIRAGFPEHDAVTTRAMSSADLLVFVITNELFEPTTAEYFRGLMFEKQRSTETILVVNKMTQDDGSIATKRAEVDRVLSPLTTRDVKTAFIDALAALEACNCDDPSERDDLLDVSAFDTFVEALNAFVTEKGHLGSLTKPLFAVRDVCGHARDMSRTDDPTDRAILELLHRKNRILSRSRSRLQVAFRAMKAAAAADIIRLGDGVADMIEPGKTQEEIESANQLAQKKAEERSQKLMLDAEGAVERELKEVRREVEALAESRLSLELSNRLAARGGVAGAGEYGEAHVNPEPGVKVESPSEWQQRTKRIAEISKTIGSFATRWSSGPLAEAAGVGTATAARGSAAHQAVLAVGKFFGVRFKPWGAVRVARALGNVGRVIAAVGGVLAVVAQIAEERQEVEYTQQLRDGRAEVRRHYRESVAANEQAFDTQVSQFMAEFYDAEGADIEKVTAEVTSALTSRSDESKHFGNIAAEAGSLIEAIHASLQPNDGSGEARSGG